jgi:outer membrane protein OmpA-like peptidoglycan-associated protein
MKKFLVVFATIACLCTGTQAQFLQTYTGDNYSGINGALLQPASLADSRFKYDINFFGYQKAIASNYAAYNANLFSSLSTSSSLEYYRKSLFKSYSYSDNDFQYLSAMVTISPKDAIGFTKRTRTVSNLDGMDQDVALLLYSSFHNAALTGKPLTSQKLSYQMVKYKETAFTYARVLSNEQNNFFKVGGTVKILNGIDALALYSDNVQVTPGAGTNVQFSNTNFSYGYSHNNGAGFNNGLSVGFDFGAVYEYRPDHKTFFYDMDGKKNIPRRDLNKYKFKIGASLLDVGRIKFKKTDKSGDFVANQNVAGMAAVNKNNAADINTFIVNAFHPDTTADKRSFNMSLPTALSIQADYHFMGNIYFAYMSYLPIYFKGDNSKTHNLMVNVVTARYERKNLGVGVPTMLARNGQVNMGLNLRIGAITVGTTNLSSYLIGQRKLYNLDFYVSLRSYLAYIMPPDRDGDKVSDKMDYCPLEPGLLKLEGCPDADLDGIPDYKDYCPHAAGPVVQNGCPDTDEDGVLDYLDACPTEKGFPINKGCPDRDKDGIWDVADRCPDVPGIQKNNGCPEEPIVCCADSDGDGILDRFDDCPTVFGKLVNKGCPANETGVDSQKKIEDAKQNKPENKVENKTTGKTPVEEKVEKSTPLEKDKVAPTTTTVNKIVEKTVSEKTTEKQVEKVVIKTTAEKQVEKVAEKTAEKVAEKQAEKTTEKATDKSIYSKVVPEKMVEQDTLVKPIVDRVPSDPIPVYKTVPIEPEHSKGNKKAKGKKHGLDVTTVMDTLSATVYFDKDDDKVTAKYYDDLNKIIKAMKINRTAKLIIQGHTDNDGDDEYNITLSHKRTTSVLAYMRKRGLMKNDEARVEILYFGERKPVIENTDEKKKQINRRVELKLIP